MLSTTSSFEATLGHLDPFRIITRELSIRLISNKSEVSNGSSSFGMSLYKSSASQKCKVLLLAYRPNRVTSPFNS